MNEPRASESILPNGLRVATLRLPHLHTVAVALFVRVGSRFESTRDNGLSHFVEHMMFRGTARFPDSLALNTALESLGTTLNAETGRDYTLFSVSVTPDVLGDALDVLGELMTSPRFDDIERERALVLEEINEDYDERGNEINGDDLARGLAFAGHPLGQRIIGPRRNVARFSAEDVRRHFARAYGARNCLLCVTGPVRHQEVVRAARPLAKMPSGKRLTMGRAPIMPKKPQLTVAAEGGSQTSLSLLVRGVAETHRDYAAFIALSRVLDDGMSTRLHYQLCDQRGLAYSIGAAIEPLADTSLLEIAGATAHSKVPALVAAILELLDGLRAGQISEAELAKVKRRYRFETLAILDDAPALAGWYGGASLYHVSPSIAARLAQIDELTISAVTRVARDVLRSHRMTLSLVGRVPEGRRRTVRQTLARF